MNDLKFFTTTDFEKDFKRLKKKYPSLPDDLKEFKHEFTLNPKLGVDLGSNLRKIRLSIKSKGKGKSGGARIIIYNLIVNFLSHNVILVSMFDKSDTESLSLDHIKYILRKNGY